MMTSLGEHEEMSNVTVDGRAEMYTTELRLDVNQPATRPTRFNVRIVTVKASASCRQMAVCLRVAFHSQSSGLML